MNFTELPQDDHDAIDDMLADIQDDCEKVRKGVISIEAFVSELAEYAAEITKIVQSARVTSRG